MNQASLTASEPLQPTFYYDLSMYPKLSKEQAGHIRHFQNLAFQPDGEWRHMGTQEPMQEFLDAYRYQLAVMTYSAAVTHYHRLPALRSIFKPLIRQLIHKMLRREVWGYWFNTSHGGPLTNPAQKSLRTPWADPIVKENIMYSGHLLMMTSLYAMLFDDDEFEKPGSLVFQWNPLFWGMGPETFTYHNRSLQKAILAEMERNGWVGVCCEPNLVFVVCNQFPIIAMRYNDVRDGTSIVKDVLKKYQKAWDRKGMVSSDGLLVNWFMVEQDSTAPPNGVGFTAWAGAFMNSWNSEFVYSKYDQQALGFITNIDGEISLRPEPVARAIRKLVTDDGASATSSETLQEAVRIAAESPPSKFPFLAPIYGYVTEWLSELGKTAELEALIKYADENLNATWENGGYFYRRSDGQTSQTGDWTHMDPFSGNAGIPYSRLNIKDGQKIMWEEPWGSDTLAKRPWVDGVDLGSGVDLLRGVWDDEKELLLATARTWDGRKVILYFVARNLPIGNWGGFVNGVCKERKEIVNGGSFELSAEVAGEDVDVVFCRLQ